MPCFSLPRFTLFFLFLASSVFVLAGGDLALLAPLDDPAKQSQTQLVPTTEYWVFETRVKPEHFVSGGAAGFRFTDDRGNGFQVDFKPRNGGVMLVELKEGRENEAAHIDRNPTMNLAEKGYTFRLEFNLRVVVGDGRVQLYLGFHDLPADLIHAELTTLLPDFTHAEVFCAGGEVTFSDATVSSRDQPPPDLAARPAIRDAMPTWAEFVGTHYIARDAIKLYRGLFYDPIIYRVLAPGEEEPPDHRPWVAYVARANLPPECEPRVGPFSGETIWLKQARIDEILAWNDAHDAFMLHGRDVMKRTEYLSPLETMVRKDELYWSVRGFCERRAAADLPVIFHLGNEVNAFHVPWKNHPHLVSRVVEYNLAPAMDAVRRASADVYGDAEALPIMLGSITSPWPLGHGFLNAMVNSPIEGDMAPSLAGRSVDEFGDYATVHYTMKGPFWSHYLEGIYRRMVVSGKVKGFWSTEELGGNADVHRAPYMVAAPFRYLDWWSRRDWAPRRGGLIYWGDTRSRDGYTTAVDVQEMVGGFLGDHALVNLTDRTKVVGSADVEQYAFATKDDGDVAAVIGVMSKDYWFFPNNPAQGELQVGRITVGREEWRGRKDLRMVWLRVVDDRIERVYAGSVVPDKFGNVSWRPSAPLDRSEEEVLLGFISSRGSDFDSLFNYRMQPREASQIRNGAEIVSFHYGNDAAADLADSSAWTMLSNGGLLGQSAVATSDNLDAGMAGDHHGLTVDRRVEQRLTHVFSLGADHGHGPVERIEFSLKGDPVSVWWDGELLAEDVSPHAPEVKVAREHAHLFEPGDHRIELRNGELKTTTIDAMALSRKSP